MSGGNLAECFVGGWTAGRNAARLHRGRPSLRSLPVRERPRPSTDMTHPPAPAPRNNRRSVDASVLRLENPELLRGRARFVDDVKLPGTLSAAFVRSPFAHAMFRNIDTSVARTMPGVHAIYTLEDLRPHLSSDRTPLGQSVSRAGRAFRQRACARTSHLLSSPATRSVMSAKPSRWSSPKIASTAEDAASRVDIDYEALASGLVSRCRPSPTSVPSASQNSKQRPGGIHPSDTVTAKASSSTRIMFFRFR